MKKYLSMQLIVAPLFAVALLMTAGYTDGGMVVFLKDGRVIQVPVNREDIIGLSFEEGPSATNDKIQESKAPAEKSANAMCQACQATNRNDVYYCNYPKRDVQATKECLADAKRKFDSCWQDNACK
jgi:hypothetical protein